MGTISNSSQIGIISVIPKDFSHSAFDTMEKSLRTAGYSLFPGCARYILPYKEYSGKWRTGLDENAKYIEKLEPAVQKLERERIKETRKQLELALQVEDLGPYSKYWDQTELYKLKDQDNIFNLEDPYQLLTFCWLTVHPTIARSLEAYKAGEYPAETHFYVKDSSLETKQQYELVKVINTAIGKLNAFDLEKRKKIARLVGLPVLGDETEELVYTQLDRFLKNKVVENGPFKGRNPIEVFNHFADLKSEEMHIRDIVEQALIKQIYRVGKGGRIFEGNLEVFSNKDEMVYFYLSEKNQHAFLELEEKLTLKKQLV